MRRLVTILHRVERERERHEGFIHCVEKQELVLGGYRDCSPHHRLELGTWTQHGKGLEA